MSGLEFYTVYTWHVNATDSGSGQINSEKYTFATESGENEPPGKPTIEGPTSGKTGTTYNFSFTAIDPNDDLIWYYIDWGDGSNTGWIGPFNPNETAIKSHTWFFQGTYILKAKAKDQYDAEGSWEMLVVSMPKNKLNNFNFNLLNLLFERFPNMFPTLRQILSYKS